MHSLSAKATPNTTWAERASVLSAPPTSSSPTLLHVEGDRTLGHFFAIAAQKWKEISYLGYAPTGAEALEVCRTQSPSIVLMDLQLPDVDGCELIGALQRIVPAPRTIVLTANVTQLTLLRLAAFPIAGLISKTSCDGETLRTALREIIAGRVYFSAEMKAQTLAFRGAGDAFHKILSDRELELLPLFGAGWDDMQIAERTGISSLTVKRHRATVLAKLDLHSTPALMRWAAQAGFVSYRGGGLRLHSVSASTTPVVSASRAASDSASTPSIAKGAGPSRTPHSAPANRCSSAGAPLLFRSQNKTMKTLNPHNLELITGGWDDSDIQALLDQLAAAAAAEQQQHDLEVLRAANA